MKSYIDLNVKNLKENHTEMSHVVLNGEEVIRAVKSEKIMGFDENTYVKVKDLDFHNGIIEVKMLSRLLPDAPDFARGFIGIAFRITKDDDKFESFYVRPTNGRIDDPVRRAHGCQYFSYPNYTFAYFREHGIEGYEAPVDIGLDEWIALKAVINGDKAEFYINDKLTLVVDKMKHGADLKGSIGLFVEIGTEAFFKDLVVTVD